MNHADFLARVIEDGMKAVEIDYADQPMKREGALLGFTECQGLNAPGIAALLQTASDRAQKALFDQAEDYWFWRCRAAEIGWVANVLSAALMNSGLPTIVTPTMRGMMKAADIVGVSEQKSEATHV